MPEPIRGLEFPSTPSPADVSPFHVGERTDLAVATLASLGLVADKGAALEHIGQQMQSFNDQLRVDKSGLGTETFYTIDLSERFGLEALIKAYNTSHGIYMWRPRSRCYPTRIPDFWKQYSAVELNSRQPDTNLPDDASAVSQMGIAGHPRAMLLNYFGGQRDPGLFLVNRSLEVQKMPPKEQIGYHISFFDRPEFMSPVDYIMLTAQRRQEGVPLLDDMWINDSSKTRFVQIEPKRVPDMSWYAIPVAQTCDGLCLSFGDEKAHPKVGVRFTAGLKVESYND